MLIHTGHDHVQYIPLLKDVVAVGILIVVDDEDDVICSVVLVVVVVVVVAVRLRTVEEVCCIAGAPVSRTLIQSIATKYSVKF